MTSSVDTDLHSLRFVPCEPVTDGDRAANIQMRRVDGRLTLLTYTTLDLLVEACGPHQGWIAIPIGRIEDMRVQVGAAQTVEDIAIEQRWRVNDGGTR